MMEACKAISRKAGIDRAVFFVLVGRGVSFITQPITLYLIARYFTPSEQGYYYTFANILSLSIFLELGLGVVITQFASHEYAYLSWTDNGSLTGNSIALSRLVTILRKSMKWYGVLAGLFLLILTPIGLYFFGANSDAGRVNFTLPWLLLVAISTINLYVYPVLTVIEGCGKVAELQQMRLMQAIVGALAVWLVIIGKGTLFAATVLAGTNLAVSIFWLFRNFKGLLTQVKTGSVVQDSVPVSWFAEIFPMQWRIALSWASGYLIFQLFNPLLFRYQGAAVAGQMGMSMNVANVALTVSIAWISTKYPLYGALIQKKRYDELDRLAIKCTSQALVFNLLLSVAVIMAVYLIKHYFPDYGSRVLSPLAIGALLLSNLINLVTTSMANYLRAHKAEPFLINSMVGAAITVVIAWISSKYYNAEVLTYSMAAQNVLIGLPLAAYVLYSKRKQWHGGTAGNSIETGF